LGAAYARGLAQRGLNVVLVARRQDRLAALADEVAVEFAVQTRCVDGDLADSTFVARLCNSVSDLDLGVVVYNAAHIPVGPFETSDTPGLMKAVQVNVMGPLILLRSLLPAMVERGRGALVLMSSLAGQQGSPRLATYAATKAFANVLAEGLWGELREKGIDVISCRAGAIRTPGYARRAGRDAPGTLDAEVVAEQALSALDRGPVVVPGGVNRMASWMMSRLLSRRAAISLMKSSTGNLGHD
jgi:hypothetical protein